MEEQSSDADERKRFALKSLKKMNEFEDFAIIICKSGTMYMALIIRMDYV